MLTVLMTTYNESKEIFKKSLDSILNQTIKDFKVLIVVDNPKNVELIKTLDKYIKKDSRISKVINEENLGLALSLNRGIDLINTKYIARMDADDIADKTRLEKQLAYAESHPNVDLISTSIIYIDENDEVLYKRDVPPTTFDKIKKAQKYVNILNHPTFFCKTEVLKKLKYRDLRYSQDYDLTCRLMENGYIINTLPEYLLNFRSSNQKSEKKLILQKITYFCIQKYFRKGILSNIDINLEINKAIKKVNEKKFLKSIKIHDKAFEYKKSKKYFKFIGYLLISAVMNKYQMKQLINLFCYSCIRGGQNEN